jgi:energy-coupling factor transporter transmembrane protein EcfT
LSDDKLIKVDLSGTFLMILTLIFVVAKITGHLTWSWLWVFSPLWLPFIVIVSFGLIAIVGIFLYEKHQKIKGENP